MTEYFRVEFIAAGVFAITLLVMFVAYNSDSSPATKRTREQEENEKENERIKSCELKERNELIRAGRSCFTCKYALESDEYWNPVYCYHSSDFSSQLDRDTKKRYSHDWCFQYQPKIESAK